MAGPNFFYTFFITLFHTPFPLSFILSTTLSICSHGKAVAIAADMPRIADKRDAPQHVIDMQQGRERVTVAKAGRTNQVREPSGCDAIN